MQLLLQNLATGQNVPISGSAFEAESVLRKLFPDVTSQIGVADLGAVMHEISRLSYVDLQVLQGPVPSPHPPQYDPVSYGMHEFDDPWLRASDSSAPQSVPDPSFREGFVPGESEQPPL